MRGGSLNPLVAGRCLTMGRAIQDLDTSNVYCQILGGVGADAFLSASESSNNKAARIFAFAQNMAAKKSADTSTTSMTLGEVSDTVLVASLVSSQGGSGNQKEPAGDEWLYQLQNVQSQNPFKETNDVLHQLWSGKVPTYEVERVVDKEYIAHRWALHVSDLCVGSATEARSKLEF
eukprot:GILI01026084.1.p1 GENE.GILI01026084.1~~GILI01026084.1.p1  ORF type:complete len:176 (-),score=23.64 GILI01026084.1:82-609(-)